MDLPPAIQRFLASAPAPVRSLHDHLVALGMVGTYARYLADAEPDVLAAFFRELARVDFDWLARHRAALLGESISAGPSDLTPVEPAVISPAERADLDRAGRESLARGEWAALVLAGGASTRFYAEAHTHPKARELVSRLGFEPPKGLFPIGPVSGWSFLELFAAETLVAGVENHRMPFLLILVSEATAGPIRDWLNTSALHGFPKDHVIVLPQTVHPRLDEEGDLLVFPDGRLAWTGDGHGGAYRALSRPMDGGRRVLDDLRERGVRGLVLHNVDNAAARALDPVRIGFHVRASGSLTLSVVLRSRLDEKVGLVALDPVRRRIEITEYSVCPRVLSEALDPDGLPRFRLAHICTNLVSLGAIRADLPPTLYRGKAIRVGDRLVQTSTYEMLNQHLSGLLDPQEVQILLLDRDEYFLPTKTLTGPDSHETTVAALAARGRRRLREAGASVADSAIVEVAPCLTDLSRAGVGAGWVVGPGTRVFLGVRHGVRGAPPFSPGLQVGDEATVRIEAERPHGPLRVDPRTRSLSEDPSASGRIRVGQGVRLAPGAVLDVLLEGDAVLVVEDGAMLSGVVRFTVPPGETLVLTRDGRVRHGSGE